MEEKQTLLLEKEARVEEKLEKAKQKINLSSIQSQVNQQPQQENIVIETPNYDLIPDAPPQKQKRILKLQKEVEKTQPKKKTSFLKKAIVASILALTVGLGVFTAVDLSNSISAYNAASSQYSVNLANLLKNISSVDSGNKMAELIQTYPDELLRPEHIQQQSNWFDRFCNFLSGLFGG